MYDMMKRQNFGVEIELTGITRRHAAQVIADYFGTAAQYYGTGYQTYTARDRKGRTWKTMRDASIRTYRKDGSRIVSADTEYSCEVVTPILQYEDIEDLQNIIRALRAAGAIANESCGIHIHVDGANHTPASLIRLMTYAIGRQDLIYESLQIGDRADRWCRKMNRRLMEAMRADTSKTRRSLEQIWYSAVNDNYDGTVDHQHYNATRYHGINLHAYFTKGTVEFRLFNGTTHAGKIKAYIQFCLALSAWAIECPSDNLHFKSIASYTPVQKATIMNNMLKRRLGLTGPEFKTCRLHLTAPFKGTEETAA